MHRFRSILFCYVLFISLDTIKAANWAVLVAGSNGWYNYRHQADLCHSYQILHQNGIPDSNIIVMMYDDIAHNRQNPTKGVIINHPNGKDVYLGVPHDYTGKNVTPKNFLNVLMGNKEALKNVGSGKVLESGPDDNVFIDFTDHGAVGLVAFPTGVLYATDLNTTINKMYSEKKYKEMVIYIEACESGSMLENILADNLNIYASTASNAEESSYACYYDEKRNTYLGDVYSVVWMEDSDVEKIDQETLYQQFLVTRNYTNTSHVMEYGDLTLGKTHRVSEFQSSTKNFQHFERPVTRRSPIDDVVPTKDVRLAVITRRLASNEANSLVKDELERELAEYLRDRENIVNRVHKIVSLVLSQSNQFNEVSSVIDHHLKLTEHRCYRTVTERVQEKCFDLQNELVLNKLFIFANLCQMGFYDFSIVNAIERVCNERLHLNY